MADIFGWLALKGCNRDLKLISELVECGGGASLSGISGPICANPAKRAEARLMMPRDIEPIEYPFRVLVIWGPYRFCGAEKKPRELHTSNQGQGWGH
jgi:hypothetical protein